MGLVQCIIIVVAGGGVGAADHHGGGVGAADHHGGGVGAVCHHCGGRQVQFVIIVVAGGGVGADCHHCGGKQDRPYHRTVEAVSNGETERQDCGGSQQWGD